MDPIRQPLRLPLIQPFPAGQIGWDQPDSVQTPINPCGLGKSILQFKRWMFFLK
jgi:hypothetical protein